MQSGNVSASVVEATAETHYSYQQQTSQQISQQSQNQNQIVEQAQLQTTQIQVQNQMQSQNQMPQQQVHTLRQMSQQPLNQPSQLNQQQQALVTQDQQTQNQLVQQIHQLQRHHREQFEKQKHLHLIDKQHNIHLTNQQEQQMETHQNNNIIVKSDEPLNQQNSQIIHKIKNDPMKTESINQNFTPMQSPSEVFLSLGFKDPLSVQEDKDFKDFVKSDDEAIARASISHISEFLRIRPGTDQTPLVTVNPQAISQTQNRLVLCCDCGKHFPTMAQLQNHDCSASLMNEVTDISMKEELTQINGNSFSCDICNKPFKRKEHLFQHRKLHTGERPYVCPTCSKAFSRKEHLVRHLVSHTGQKQHECEMCGKSFSRKDNLHKHRKTHGVSGPYVCPTCGKSFVVKHYYQMHVTTHAVADADGTPHPDPLPYKCDLCDKAFSVKSYLTTHKSRHRPKTNSSNAQNILNNQQRPPVQHPVQQQVQHQVQQGSSSNLNIVRNNPTSVSNVSNSTNHSTNGSVIDIQNAVDREQQNESFNSNQYQGNVSQYQ